MDNPGQLGAVLLVLALLAGAVYALRNKRLPGFVRNMPFPSGPKRLQVLERVALTAQHTLCLVRVGDRELIITTAPGNCQVTPVPMDSQS